MTLIEAAARASWNATKGYGTVDWDGLAALPEDTIGHRTAERHRAIVRAAIIAIRSPNAAMTKAGIAGIRDEHPGIVWCDMIDTLLAEHPEPLA